MKTEKPKTTAKVTTTDEEKGEEEKTPETVLEMFATSDHQVRTN